MTSTTVVRVFAVSRTCVFAVVFMGTVGLYLPRYLRLLEGPSHWTDWRVVGIAPLLVGAYIALRCAFAFAWVGHGTPAPFDAPRRLVITGLYRYVRNPMYFGMGVLMVGEWLLFGSNLRGALTYLAIYAACVTTFVFAYEEPTLRSKFPEAYGEYCRNVPRFIPRLTPWQAPAQTAAAN